jgi:class 3 adenylate cyclase
MPESPLGGPQRRAVVPDVAVPPAAQPHDDVRLDRSSEPPALSVRPYVPDLLRAWQPTHGDDRHMQVSGTLALVDISGFTRLTERLARKGNAGAEEMSDLLDATFSALLADARAQGADLIKWGGDAVLLLFSGAEHAARACRAAFDMRATLRTVGTLSTTSGTVTLRMSVGVHSGTARLLPRRGSRSTIASCSSSGPEAEPYGRARGGRPARVRWR